MRLAHEIAKAIGHLERLTLSKIDLDTAILEGRPIYYWHSLNGVFYTRYQLVTSNIGTNILICREPRKRTDEIVEVGVCSWSYVEVGDRITDTLHAFPEGLQLWLGDEVGDRVRIGVMAETIRVGDANCQQRVHGSGESGDSAGDPVSDGEDRPNDV